MWEKGSLVKYFDEDEVDQIYKGCFDLAGLVLYPNNFKFENMTFEKPHHFDADMR